MRISGASGSPGRLMMTLRRLIVLVVFGCLVALAVLPAWATYPGENGKIVFASLHESGADIQVIQPDGSGLVQLTDSAEFDTDPRWSPDGTQIVFSSSRDGNSEIYVMDADGSGVERLTNHPDQDMRPAWSPDGQQIAFVSDRGGTLEIYLMNTDGSGVVRLTNQSLNLNHVAIKLDWSPDGSRIAFSDVAGGLRIIGVDGSGLRQLADGWLPSWSPDGTQIAYTSASNMTLSIIKPDELSPPKVSTLSAQDPAWSPDGEWIAYQASNGDLRLADADTLEDQSAVFSSPSVDGRLDWQPLSESVSPPSGSFDDVPADHVFADDIAWLADSGITRGCNPPVNDRFCPDDLVTRGQMAAFLVRGLGYADDGGGDLFVDDDASVFESDIDKLATAGVTRGCNPPVNDRFCPEDPVTRGQMAAFLVRALGYSDDGGGDLFVDDDGSVFESDIDRLGTAGVTRGCNPPVNDRFCPDDPVTRGQMAAFLHRALDS